MYRIDSYSSLVLCAEVLGSKTVCSLQKVLDKVNRQKPQETPQETTQVK